MRTRRRAGKKAHEKRNHVPCSPQSALGTWMLRSSRPHCASGLFGAPRMRIDPERSVFGTEEDQLPQRAQSSPESRLATHRSLLPCRRERDVGDGGVVGLCTVPKAFQPFEIRDVDRAHLAMVSRAPPPANVVDCDEESPRLHVVRKVRPSCFECSQEASDDRVAPLRPVGEREGPVGPGHFFFR